MSEKRKFKRFPRRHQVRYGESEFTQLGFTGDLSTSGMFVVGTRPKLESRIHIELQVDALSKLYFEGRVVRLIEVPPNLRQIRKAGFGVRFLTSAELLGDLLPKGLAQLPSLAPANPQLELSFDTPEALATASEREFKRGGAFAWGTGVFAVNSQLQIRVTAAWLQKAVTIDAQVVNVIAGPDGRSGVAVMFRNLAEAMNLLGELT